MKKIFLILFSFLSLILSAQYTNSDGYSIWKGRMAIGSALTPISSVHLQLGDSATTKALWLPRVQDTSAITSPRQGMMVYSISDQAIYYRTPAKWEISGTSTGGGYFNGSRPVTRDFSTITGVTPGGANISAFLDSVFYPSQNPTSALTATYSATTATSFSLELMSSGAALSVTLNWTGGRLAATRNLSSINVDAVNQTFSQPSAPGTVSGTKSASLTRNTNTTYTNLVTTVDSKTASSSVSFNWYPKRYWGYTTTLPPSSADVVTAAGGSGELTTTKVKSSFDVVVTGTNKHVFYAYPSSYGALSSINVSGLESIGAFTQSTVSVTNASGYVQNYYVYTSNNLFNNTTISFISVN
jgi:hypothetical protein